jgi:tetrahydromethanopterin S-methyltransferase subunit C
MSAAGGGPSEADISPEILLALGVIGGLLGIYLSDINVLGGVIAPVLGSLGAVCAIIWGADAIRRVASYGLGTGVPSIGYMSLALGIIGALVGVALAAALNLTIIGPVLGLVAGLILGAVVGIVAKVIVKMKIAVLIRCTAEISGAAALAVLGFSSAVAGGYGLDLILAKVIAPGFIALFFIFVTMAIQHPFNACLGPNENQVRTIKLAVSTAFSVMTITGILAIFNPSLVYAGVPAWLVILVIGAIGWVVSLKSFICASNEAAAEVSWNAEIPKVEE